MGKGSGKKKIEIKKIEKKSSRMVTFSKRRRGLFKKVQELQSKTGATVAIIVFSPAGRPFTLGDVDSISAALINTSHAHNTADGLGDGDDEGASISAPSTCTSNHNDSKEWVDNVTIEGCNGVDRPMTLQQQLDFVGSFLS